MLRISGVGICHVIAPSARVIGNWELAGSKLNLIQFSPAAASNTADITMTGIGAVVYLTPYGSNSALTIASTTTDSSLRLNALGGTPWNGTLSVPQSGGTPYLLKVYGSSVNTYIYGKAKLIANGMLQFYGPFTVSSDLSFSEYVRAHPIIVSCVD